MICNADICSWRSLSSEWLRENSILSTAGNAALFARWQAAPSRLPAAAGWRSPPSCKRRVSPLPARAGAFLFSADVFMSTSSKSPAESARNGVQLVLQRMQDAGKAGQVAVAMGISEATVSRIKNERVEEVLLMLAHLGIKAVPADYKCVSRETYEFLTVTHQRVMSRAPELIWDVEE